MKQELAPRGVGIPGLQAGEDVKAAPCTSYRSREQAAVLLRRTTSTKRRNGSMKTEIKSSVGW